ncbi:enoyl-CoA hydratase/isomerase family protein [Aquabacterium sp. OR-4]|uniref:enoyl-CoA hydratase/isomerase family protein n=1 Tax=Aquabacterium sp. OR-4 TaxID=2978127 RepID=UPI0021B20ED5|nr:enoyl-CoA hydratase/isomerase family protein [Aquabacterium sp. OR-4]MDT7835709.1 enoyl-CoA hydratase/isomerase family protein [Aquabacterium sp. OR-4]
MNTDALPPGPPRLQISAGHATITLSRPAHHNRLQVEDLLALQQHVQTLQALPELRVVVLAAGGKSFCSGFDLGALAAADSGTPGAVGAGPRLFEETVDALEALPVPTVCRLQGGVYGGATDLALACDFRVGVQGMVLRMPAARIGLHYYASGLRRYVTRLGLQQAKRLFLLAEEVAAEQLLAMGYLDRLVPADRLDAEVAQLVAALGAGAPLALRGMKSSLNEVARAEYHLSVLREREALCAASDDLQEGQRALAEKRLAQFHGR